jgi:FlaA1/EpsC-like NDP-sugar epimerase
MQRELSQFTLSKNQRAILLAFIYVDILIFSTWLAYNLRFDFGVLPAEHKPHMRTIWSWVWLVKLGALWATGQFSSLLSYFSLPDLKRIAIGQLPITLALIIGWYCVEALHFMSRSVIIMDAMISLLGISAMRLMFRILRLRTDVDRPAANKIHVAIVGAGAAGAALARELQSNSQYDPVAFFDDSEAKRGTQVHGINVYGAIESLMDHDLQGVTEAIIAMPSANGKRIQEIVHFLNDEGIQCRTLPSVNQLASGEMIASIRPLEIHDILGRDPVDLECGEVPEVYSGRTILISGAGGSIGSELCRQIINLETDRLVLVDICEYNLFRIRTELDGAGVDIHSELIDIREESRVHQLMKRHQPDVIFHAAAFKHVDLLESQVEAAIENNIKSTNCLAKAAEDFNVGRFVLISTDKAVNPTSVMGESKRAAELLVEAYAQCENEVKFMSVRFGNVLGSSGSVVPIFDEQIKTGGPVTVRDKRMTRFFMSIPEAAGLVLRSAAMGVNGDRFILDMGKPVKICDLAQQMISLAGMTLGKEIDIQYTGMLAGEKLHEELIYPDEIMEDTSHTKIRKIKCSEPTKQQNLHRLITTINSWNAGSHTCNRAWLHNLLKEHSLPSN